ncbi:MAG: glycosyltransferase [Agrobacterium sp.]|nr:glycosyltransferase [Agrobacterium sp.]
MTEGRETSEPKIVVFHDYFAIRGGGERLVLTLANRLGTRLVYGYRTPDSFEPEMFPTSSHSLGLPNVLRRAGMRPLALAVMFMLAGSREKDRGVRIFSGVAAPFAVFGCRQNRGANIFYCHTPPRFLYDQRDYFISRLPGVAKPVAKPLLWLFERFYRRAVDRMDVIVANSGNIAGRVRQYLGKNSIVVPPPVDTDRFLWRNQGDYYLSTARLSPLKQVDRIIDAFVKMPHKRLVVASGGEELERLRASAGGAANIELRGWVSDEQLLDLIGNAIATIYLPRDEDFGMSPVESMAAGKPVIGIAEGGLLETVIDGETGILLPKDFSDAQLMSAVEHLTPETALSMRPACEACATRFSRQVFVERMKEVVAGAAQRSGDMA